MPSVGQYKRYISQGEAKIAKLKVELTKVSGSKKSEVKELLNLTTAKVKEHKAAIKSAPVGKAASKPASKKSAVKKVVAKKAAAVKAVAPVNVVAPAKAAVAAPSLSQFKKLEALVADLTGKVEMLTEKVCKCCNPVSETTCTSSEETTES